MQIKQEKVERQLLDIFYGYLGKNLVFIPVFIALTTWLLWSWVPHTQLLIWFVVFEFYFLCAFIPSYVFYIRKKEQRPLHFWMRSATVHTCVVSVITGFLPWIAFDYLDPQYVILLAVGFSLPPAITIPYMSCSLPIWLSSNLSLMVPLAAHTFLRWDFNPLLGYIVGTWMVLHTVHMYSLAKDSHIRLRKYFEVQAELEESKQKAESALKTKNDFLATTSHDIRQPIDALALLILVLRDKAVNDETRSIFEKIEKNIAAQKNIYDMLLNISRLDSDQLQIHYEAINLNEILQNLYMEFEMLAKEKNLDLSVDQSDIRVFTDKRLLESVLRNLLSNAVKYTEKGSVKVAVEENEKHIQLSIEDTGKGIAKEQQQKIFDEFYQVEGGTSDDTKGLGLGLAIVKRSAELINCRVNLQSEIDKGSTFALEVPRAI